MTNTLKPFHSYLQVCVDEELDEWHTVEDITEQDIDDGLACLLQLGEARVKQGIDIQPWE